MVTILGNSWLLVYAQKRNWRVGTLTVEKWLEAAKGRELEDEVKAIFNADPSKLRLTMPNSIRKSLSFSAAVSPRLCFFTAISWPFLSTPLNTFAYPPLPTKFSAHISQKKIPPCKPTKTHTPGSNLNQK
jgi:hypothetical protein